MRRHLFLLVPGRGWRFEGMLADYLEFGREGDPIPALAFESLDSAVAT